MADAGIAPVAKACGSCAKSKAKCEWDITSMRCHRCTRLSKECRPQESVRKRKNPKIRRAVQIAHLEDKVNTLLSVVAKGQTQSIPQPPCNPPSLTSERSTSALSGEKESTIPPNPALLQCRAGNAGLPRHFPSILTVELGTNDPDVLVIDPDELLSTFQSRLASSVPFVVIPPDMTAEILRREKPFLYITVMMAASYGDTGRQLMLGKTALEHMAERLILRGEKSLDLLQGLLILLSWYHYFLQINHQLNNLLALVSALFVDLGLKRVSADNEVNEAFLQITNRTQGKLIQSKQLTSEEKRAMLGCYYLSSCLTSSFSRMDCLRFTPYIEECCEASSHSNDVNFASLMKLQSLVEKQRLSGLWEILDCQNSDMYKAPASVLVRSCQIKLQNFRNSLSDNQLSNNLFALSYYSAEIHLYESCFKMSPPTGADYTVDSFRLVDITHCCFLATRNFFEVLLPIPAALYCTLTAVNFGQMFHALGALYKLSIFDVDWDARLVRNTLSLSSVLSQISLCSEQAGNSYGPNEANSPWFFLSRKLRTLQSWWNAQMAQEAEYNSAFGNLQDGPFDDFHAMINLDFLNEDFWKC